MELYSKRKKKDCPPKALCYDLQEKFRFQVWHIWNKAMGFVDREPPRSLYQTNTAADMVCRNYSMINEVLCEEHGLLSVPGRTPCCALFQWFNEADTDLALDIIEVSFRAIRIFQEDFNFMGVVRPSLKSDDAVNLLNHRFQENGIGFRFEEGRIIQISSEFLHSEVTEPALRLLFTNGYTGALDEFQIALDHYRHKRYDDSLTNCLKALESTLQKIISVRNWAMPSEAKFDSLFAEVKRKGLFPAYLENQLGELKKFLQAVAVIRNKEGAHGSGPQPNEVPEYLVAYQIHLTGSAIVFLIRCNENHGK